MCLVIAFIAIIYAISAFNAGNMLLGSSGLLIALFFTGLLIRNVLHVRKIRNNMTNDIEKEEE